MIARESQSCAIHGKFVWNKCKIKTNRIFSVQYVVPFLCIINKLCSAGAMAARSSYYAHRSKAGDQVNGCDLQFFPICICFARHFSINQ